MGKFLKLYSLPILCATIVAVVSIVVHTWKIVELPYGVFSDEVSIGVNAYDIAYTGYDEHGEFMPLYFEAFGEYKNPVYIYSLAVLMKLFGPSIFLLRMTSALWFFAFQLGLFFFLKKYFQSFWAGLFGVIVSTIFPLIFPLSRVSFELVSQLATLAWAIYTAYSAYVSELSKRRMVWAGFAMLFFVLSFFAYSTGKFLTPVFLGVWWIIFWRKHGMKEVLYQMFLALLLVSPVFFFIHTYPGALTARFETLTYFQNPDLPFAEKLKIFLQNYTSYFSLDFWVLKGDENLRHHVGVGGMAFVSVLILSIVGIGKTLITKHHKAFEMFLLALLVVTPVAAALTEPDHALRVHVMALFMIFFAVKALAYISTIQKNFLILGILTLFAATFVFESYSYSTYYFGPYRDRSAVSFETGNLDQSLITASSYQPTKIVFESNTGDLYLQRMLTFFFYRFLPELQQKPLPEVYASTEWLEHYCKISKPTLDSSGAPYFQVYCQ